MVKAIKPWLTSTAGCMDRTPLLAITLTLTFNSDILFTNKVYTVPSYLASVVAQTITFCRTLAPCILSCYAVSAIYSFHQTEHFCCGFIGEFTGHLNASLNSFIWETAVFTL